MMTNVDIMLEDLGYDPEKWRERNQKNYEQIHEGRKYYTFTCVYHDKHDPFTFDEFTLTKQELWDGQRA